jgi:aspartate aminotransferase
MLRKVAQLFRMPVAINRQFWSKVEMGPKDPILGVNEAYKADKNPEKLNFGVGAYRDDDGNPVVLPSVREAERRVFEKKMYMEYDPIIGNAEMVKGALKLVYGTDPQVLEKIAAVQSLSGTGCLRVVAGFIKRNWDGPLPTVYNSNPTWGNHFPIFNHQGINTSTYPYWDPKTLGMDYDGFMKTIKDAPERSAFVIHATAHNPTGVDPTIDQWRGLSAALKEKNHLVIVDSAYQGFASGDFDKDKVGLDIMVADGHQVILCQSFAKNFGLYGQRVGCCSVMCSSKEEQEIVMSQLKIVARAMYSSPPIHGSRLVNEILSDPELTAQWKDEVKGMADRIIKMRQLLKDGLIKEGSKLNWDHVTNQIGMFAYSGMTGEQVDKLRDEWSIYMTRNGRISMAGVTSKNVTRLSKAIHAVTK